MNKLDEARADVLDTARDSAMAEVDRSEGSSGGTDLGDVEAAVDALIEVARAEERAAVIAEISDWLHDCGNLPGTEEAARDALQEASRDLARDGEP